MNRLIPLLASLAVALHLRAAASDFYAITEADKQFLSEVVNAIGKNDTAWIADQMSYPISVVTNRGRRRVTRKKEFASFLTDKLNDRMVEKIARDAKNPLFKNWQGVMVGDGLLWFTEYQSDHSSRRRYRVLAIGNFAFQPEERTNPKVGRDGRQLLNLATNSMSAAKAPSPSP